MDEHVSPLAMLRKIRGNISQEEVANALGVKRNTVSRWEIGLSTPKLEPWQTKKLCKLLSISIEELPDNFSPQPIERNAP
jgi:DNA-binding XRE family transcriptional regulator